MIAELNLSSRPFSNRTLPWIVTGVAALAAVAALVFIFSEYRQATIAASALEPETQRMRAELSALRAQDTEVREALTPDQRRTLDSAHLLVDRRGFSWSRLFTDLERALPGGVRVTRIRVRDAVERRAQTYAELELSVVSQNPATVTQMIDEMNRAGTFAAEAVAQVQRTGRGESGTEWTLNVRYAQRDARTIDDGSGGDAASNTLPSGGGEPR